MKRTILPALLLFSSLLFGIDAGKPMKDITVEKWYLKPEISKTELTAVVLFDASGNYSHELLKFLESLKAENDAVSVTAIAMNPVNVLDDIFKNIKGFSLIGLAADRNLATRNALAETESLFPYAILAKDGVVVWTGQPTELEGVVKKVKTGSFSLSTQKTIEEYRRELQTAIQSGLPAVVESTAEKILRIDGTDKIAIQAKLFALKARHKTSAGGVFLAEVCKKNPEDVKLRLLELDYLLGNGLLKEYTSAARRAAADFKGKEMVMIASYIIERSPFALLEPDFLIKCALKAYKGSASAASPAIRTAACEALAKACCVTGNMADAVKYQLEAAGTAGKNQQESLKKRLNYYRASLNLK